MIRLTKLIYTGMMNSTVTSVMNLTNQMDSQRMGLGSVRAAEQLRDLLTRIKEEELVPMTR